jgi:hypothetical protein
VLVICVAVTVANLIADIVYCMIDPRLSLRGPRRERSWGLSRLRPKPRSGITETATEG